MTKRGVRLMVGAMMLLLVLVACQSTTEDGADEAADDYPGAAGSPGISDSEVAIAVSGVTSRTSDYWLSNGPVQLALEALADDINSEGGVLDHTITAVPAFDGYDSNWRGPEEFWKSLCTFAVHQQPSFAMQGFTQYAGAASLQRAGCVGEQRMINILQAMLVPAEDLEKTPDLVAPYALDDVTAARVLISRLSEQGFFDGAQKVGVLNPGGTFAVTIRDVIVPELESRGIARPFVLIGGTKGEYETDAEANANALRVKSAGVDRVVYFNDDNSGYPTITAMADQDFTPPLGTFSNVKPQGFIDYNGYPAGQIYSVSPLGGYTFAGPGAQLTALPETAATTRCSELTERTGMKPPLEPSYLIGGCDAIMLTVAALEAGGADDPSAAAFFDGLSELSEFESAFGVTLDFSHGRAGASQVWDLQGDDSCSCLRVVGGPFPIER
jgi:Periplasmic binding protein